MITLEKTKAAEEKLKNILELKTVERERINDLIAKDNEAIETAAQQMASALAAGDDEAYTSAYNAKAKAETLIDMHKAMLNSWVNKPSISHEEYIAISHTIIAEIKSYNEEAQDKLVILAEEAATISKELAAAGEYANKVLACLQHDIYLDKDRAKHGMYGIVTPDSELSYNEYNETCRYGELMLDSYMYERISGDNSIRAEETPEERERKIRWS